MVGTHSSTPQLHKLSNILLSQIQLAITLYLLEVEVQVEDSQEAEAVVASAPSKKSIATSEIML